eukprot:TRINITY_DN113685_c0_g1_i1.p1 TRINITY_DN113685_c0_g1~~TRINITY_DN113685_c0_g1_i1.p1  ORF type:complete len:338 (-),score=36.17 TRINITY_DN113685_c0_g1_i1:449-1462(-)
MPSGYNNLDAYRAAVEPTLAYYMKSPPRIWVEGVPGIGGNGLGQASERGTTPEQWRRVAQEWAMCATTSDEAQALRRRLPRQVMVEDARGVSSISLAEARTAQECGGKQPCSQGTPFVCSFAVDGYPKILFCTESWRLWNAALRDQAAKENARERSSRAAGSDLPGLFVDFVVHSLLHEVGHALMHRQFQAASAATGWSDVRSGIHQSGQSWLPPTLVSSLGLGYSGCPLLTTEVRHGLELEADDFATMHLLRCGASSSSHAEREAARQICLGAAHALSLADALCRPCASHPAPGMRGERIRETVRVNTERPPQQQPPASLMPRIGDVDAARIGRRS